MSDFAKVTSLNLQESKLYRMIKRKKNKDCLFRILCN